MASNLKVIEPELPRSRVNLVAAIEGRKAALAKLQAADASANRLANIIAAESQARAKVDELEKRSIDATAAWARDPEAVVSEVLHLPAQQEIDDAKRSLATASRVADAARGAAGEFSQARNAASAEMQQAQSLVADAVRQVLLEEVVPVLAAQRIEHLKHAAECKSELIAAGEVFKENRPGELVNVAFGNYSKLMRETLFKGVEETRATPQMKQKYLAFAGALARDPAAKLGEASS